MVELVVSGTKLAVSVSVPVASAPAAMLIVVLPLLSFAGVEVKPPPERVTEPVGAGLPLPPFTATVTVSGCAVVIFDADGVSETVGVIFAGAVTEIVAVPVEALYMDELAVSGV